MHVAHEQDSPLITGVPYVSGVPTRQAVHPARQECLQERCGKPGGPSSTIGILAREVRCTDHPNQDISIFRTRVVRSLLIRMIHAHRVFCTVYRAGICLSARRVKWCVCSSSHRHPAHYPHTPSACAASSLHLYMERYQVPALCSQMHIGSRKFFSCNGWNAMVAMVQKPRLRQGWAQICNPYLGRTHFHFPPQRISGSSRLRGGCVV